MDGLLGRLLFAAPALTVCAALAAQSDSSSQDLSFESGPFTLDGSTNLIHFVRPQIRQGRLRIDADEAFAMGVEFDDSSEWRFKGHVRIDVDGALIEADSAVFTFDKDRLSRGELTGAPASFSDARPSADQEPVRGSANKIYYDYVARTLRMSEGGASINKDQYYIYGCDLIYDFNNERVTPGPTECEEPFRIVVRNNQPEETAGTALDSSP
jgi:lipopolysaccharide transport protein LptA